MKYLESDLIEKTETMSSLLIAELTGKRHNNVIRDIENMIDVLELDAPNFGENYFDMYNRPQKCYNLPKRECLILASGYDIKLRAKIIDRWAELETNNGYITLPQTYSEALRRLANEMQLKVIDKYLLYYTNIAIKTSNNYSKKYLYI